MATYKSDAGAILQPGNQINALSAFNTEGVHGWPGIDLFEQIGFIKVSNKSGTKASFKSFDITIPSPDRRPDDRVRDDRTSLVVKASTARPAYVYQASLAIAQDIPAGGLPSFPASPVTADLQGTNGEFLLLGPDNSGAPFGVPSTQANGLAAASSLLDIGASGIAQGTGNTSTDGTNDGIVPFWSVVTGGGITAANAANSMMFKVTADTTFKVYNVNGITGTAVNGDGVFISDTDSDEGRAAYILCRINYLRASRAVSWSDVQTNIDFASQLGGTDS
tara:strand:- start:69 stop:902 length:834 start_codon:yes stop_codon:yes gene_type:complete